jgi:hypothetical protein
MFQPSHGILVKNKDQLELIPTAKQFRDSLASLSPTQQAFCRAYRGMQLESTLLAVCVIQVKPAGESSRLAKWQFDQRDPVVQ